MDTTYPIEGDPDNNDLRQLGEAVYKFNFQATGILDHQLFASFLRNNDDAVIGGVSGWTWGKTCFIRQLFVPTEMRNQGYGTRLMDAVQAEAINRGRGQIVLRINDFQGPQYYIKHGFAVIGRIPDYPVGFQEITMIKLLPKQKAI